MWSATRSPLSDACKIALAILLLAPVPAAHARPDSARAYRSQLDGLGKQISSLNEDHNVAKLRLIEVQRQIRENEKSKAAADERLQELRGAASARAAAMYRTGFSGMLLVFFGSSSQTEFSRRAGVTSRVGDWEKGLMAKLQIANEDAEQETRDLKESLRKAKSIRDGLAAKRATLQGRQAQQRQLLDRFVAAAEAAEKARTSAARSAVTARTQNRPSAAALVPAASEVLAKPIPAPANLGASGGAKTALQTAYAQTGKPYKWGAVGPGSFDCSGLTMYAWRSAGVSLPHSSRAQYAATKRVERSDLQPGDLVFFGSPIHHVGMYVGDGKMINSPETGQRVGVRSMMRKDYVGAGRPGA